MMRQGDLEIRGLPLIRSQHSDFLRFTASADEEVHQSHNSGLLTLVAAAAVNRVRVLVVPEIDTLSHTVLVGMSSIRHAFAILQVGINAEQQRRDFWMHSILVQQSHMWQIESNQPLHHGYGEAMLELKLVGLHGRPQLKVVANLDDLERELTDSC